MGLFFNLFCTGALLLLCTLAESQSEISLRSQCHQTDLQALLEFSRSINSSNTLEWREGTFCCSWEGIECQSNRVTALRLPAKGLRGVLSASLGRLDRLRDLNLSCNSLRGEVPGTLFRLPRLETLDLSFNNFSSVIPSELPHSIRCLNISSNSLVGRFPELGFSANLTHLNVSNNSFIGPIPVTVCRNLTSLTFFDLSLNKFSGRFQEGLSQCKNLEDFNAGYNQLSGPLPNDLYEVSSLKTLCLSYSGISGNLSSRIESLSNLSVLTLMGNSLSGFIPPKLGKLRNLEELILQSNRFTGRIPPVLSQLKKIKILNLKNNSLSGNLDLNFSSFSELVYLDLASNRLSGSIPGSLWACRKVQSVSLARNNFTGDLPEGVASLQSLYFFSISNNSLSNITRAMLLLQNCGNLTTLVLSKNFHGEKIPTAISGFPMLRTLALGNCALTGHIPAWLKNCQYLQVLDLSWNRLSGIIPLWLNSLRFLFYVDLSNNSFTGPIPKELLELPSFATEQNPPQVNQTSFEPPLFIKQNQQASGLQYNQLSSLPPALYLSRNHLNGTLPAEIGLMKMLHILDLSHNHILGIIPDEVSNLRNLESLDLSNNNLSGTIPASLKALTFLSKFNVSYNNLRGQIPAGSQFDTFPKSSYVGNPSLCGSPLNSCDSPPRASPSSGETEEEDESNKLNRNTILGVAISVAVGIAFVLAAVLWGISRKHVAMKGFEDDASSEISHSFSDGMGSSLVVLFQNHNCKNLALSDIVHATGNFDQSNIIGCGGFGLVYKATLEDGSKIAIKRLTGECGQMEREFKAEVEALSRAQHKNLVSLQGYCRYGNDRLLIYSFMENGSLDYWLHEKPDGGSILDWSLRLRIAQGAAKGLAYLHRSCEPHIVHRDIKSSNILLDDKFEAHLADFGLSRLIMPSDTHVTTELVGTLGYIPPEYGQAWQATRKGDVYSFGVVLLELLTRKRPVDVCKPTGCRDLVEWVQKKKSEGKQEEIFDLLLRHRGYEDQMIQVLDIACMCINQNPLKRPAIQVVISWLDNVGVDTQQIKVFPLTDELL